MKNLIKHRGLLASFIAVLAVIAVLGLMALFIAWLCSLPICPGKGLFGNIVVSIMITLIAFLLIWLLAMFIQAVYAAVNGFIYTLVSPKYYELQHPFYPINFKNKNNDTSNIHDNDGTHGSDDNHAAGHSDSPDHVRIIKTDSKKGKEDIPSGSETEQKDPMGR